jgi:hypothetical protein
MRAVVPGYILARREQGGWTVGGGFRRSVARLRRTRRSSWRGARQTRRVPLRTPARSARAAVLQRCSGTRRSENFALMRRVKALLSVVLDRFVDRGMPAMCIENRDVASGFVLGVPELPLCHLFPRQSALIPRRACGFGNVEFRPCVVSRSSACSSFQIGARVCVRPHARRPLKVNAWRRARTFP